MTTRRTLPVLAFSCAAFVGLSHVACGFTIFTPLEEVDPDLGLTPYRDLNLTLELDGGFGAPVSDRDPNVILCRGTAACLVSCNGSSCAGKEIRCQPGSLCTIQCNDPGSCLGTRFEAADASLCIRCKDTPDGAPSCDDNHCTAGSCKRSCGAAGCGPTSGTCGACEPSAC